MKVGVALGFLSRATSPGGDSPKTIKEEIEDK